MLSDLVIDTNVLVHADDERQGHQDDVIGLLDDLVRGDAALCLDSGFDVDESKNRSLIGAEYLERLTYASTGMQVVAHLFSTGRVSVVSKSVPKGIKSAIEQCVRNKRDRTFISVAHNSDGQTLCSHDFVDMQPKKRKHLKSKVGVAIVLAEEARAELSLDPA